MKRKRLTSIMGMVIAVMMCISLLPTTALAAEDIFDIQDGVLVNYHRGNYNDAGVFGDEPFSVVIPDEVTSIGNMAFQGASAMISVTIPNSVTSIGDSSFRYAGLTSVTIPDSVTSIGDSAFLFCGNLTSVTFGSGLKSIGEGAFQETGITSVTIPDSVTSIGNGAFSSCYSLKDVKIPDSVTSMGDSVFNNGIGGVLPNVTIHCNAGSYAETYAKEKGIKFVSTGGTTTPTTPTDTTTPTTPVTPTTPPTTDKPSAWAETQVNTAISANIVPTALQGQYTQATTRAEFCALAVALYENVKGTEITERVTFNDTTDINVQKAAAIGVVSGVGNNNFAPNDTLTREQAATMLSRLAAAIGKPLTEQAATFADNNSISQWAFSAVGQVQANGVMGGVGNNTFAPQEQYTREQSIITMNRLFEIVK